jgi:hypothetical protein
MTKDEVLDQYEHAFAGMVLDAWAQNRTGEAQVLFAKRIAPKAREMLSGLFDAAVRYILEDQARFQPNGDVKELFGEKKKRGKGDE